jgi:hypothetical protein
MAMNMSMSVPRRRGFAIAWTILRTTLAAYHRGDQTITFEVGQG